MQMPWAVGNNHDLAKKDEKKKKKETQMVLLICKNISDKKLGQ